MVTVTPKAVETIKHIIQEDKRNDPIRIFFAGFSCSGPAYMLGFDQKKDDDLEVKADGFKLIYSKDIEKELSEAVIDCVDTPQGPGVVVRVKSSDASACSTCAGCH